MANKNLLLLVILGLLLLLLQCFLMKDVEAASPPPSPRISKPKCGDHCGKVTIPFPFGMERSECFLDAWYEIDCQKGIPFLKKLELQVLEISLLPKDREPLDKFLSFTNGRWEFRPYVTVLFPIIYSNSSNSKSNCSTKVTRSPPSLKGSLFIFSSYNHFTAVGCNARVMMNISAHSFVGCRLQCLSGHKHNHKPSTCDVTFPSLLQSLNVDIIDDNPIDATGINDPAAAISVCNYAFLSGNPSFISEKLNRVKMEGQAPVVLEWGISYDSNYGQKLFDHQMEDASNNSYSCSFSPPYDDARRMQALVCNCGEGYRGNPYLIDGCQDVDECEDPKVNKCQLGGCVNTQGSFHCVDPRKKFMAIEGVGSSFGAFFLILLGWWLHKIIRKRKEKKLKDKYFKQNGGLMLKQQLLSLERKVPQGKIFNQKEMEMATENFNESRILGRGSQGIVYKRMLTDGRIVAIKKARVIDENEVEVFITEAIILTQISHKNIVQLLGCCLETKIPLLVYEFVPNGSLHEYLHGSSKDRVSWEVCLQLATQIAGAFFYLHSAASIPVYHRDIKSSNILLDEKYQVKIADFGMSLLICFDQTHISTLVKGTFGYIDLEYVQSNQYTEKSDVYSFGVVLVEILTRQKPVFITMMGEDRNLAAHFKLSVEEGHLFDVFDPTILNQDTAEEILKVANLAKRCLDINGRNQPTMREVTIELEGIKKLQTLSNIQKSEENHDQVQCQDILRSTSAGFEVDTNVATFVEYSTSFAR